MSLPLSLAAVLKELSLVQSGELLYVHRQSGELCVVSEEDVSLLCDVDETLLPPAQVAFIDGIRHILISDDWIDLPSPQSIGEDPATLAAFAQQLDAPALRAQLQALLDSPNGGQRVVDFLSDQSLEEAWYQFQQQFLGQAVGDRLTAYRIPYQPNDTDAV